MRIKKLKKQIRKIDRRLEHYNNILKTLGVGSDRDNCMRAMARLVARKIELEKELEQEKIDFRIGILSLLAYAIGGVAVFTIFLSVFFMACDQESEYQRNKVANHRIEQAYIVK